MDPKGNTMKTKFFLFSREADALSRLHNDAAFDFANIRDDRGNSLLHHAANSNYQEATRMYIKLLLSDKYWKARGK